jgi:hypothetical protein
VIIWYAAGAILAVWLVFQSTGLDFRFVAVGGLVPLLDALVGHQAVLHSLLAPTLALTLVMAVTAGRGRRLLRRRLIGVPIGWYFGLVLAGAFAHREVFWFPAFGGDFGDVAVWPAWPWAVGLEIVGLFALRTIWSRAGLADRVNRAAFVRDGRLDLP